MLAKRLQKEELYLFSILRITASNKEVESRKSRSFQDKHAEQTAQMNRLEEVDYKINRNRKLFENEKKIVSLYNK